MTLLKTLLFTVLVPGTVTVLLPYELTGWRAPAQVGVANVGGLLLLCAGAAIYAHCAWHFTFSGQGTPALIDPPKVMVARGLYRYTRNPMYVGVLCVLLGESLWFAAGRLLAYAALVGLLFHLFVTLYEEPDLTRRFGAAYQQYCQNVPRWFGWRS